VRTRPKRRSHAAIGQATTEADLGENQRWQTLEYICSSYLVGVIVGEIDKGTSDWPPESPEE
jgi:hypothetical protein